MQQYDVIRRLAGTVEEFTDGGECLEVGKVAVAAGDSALQEPGAGALSLHLGVVVALQRDAVKIAETVKKVGRDMAEVGGEADAIAEAVDYKAVRAKAVMSEVNRGACEAVDRREGGDIEWAYKWDQIGRAEGEAINLIGMAVDRDVQAAEGRSPAGRKVVRIELGEAQRSDVAYEGRCQRR
jgi:hypothetical protein